MIMSKKDDDADELFPVISLIFALSLSLARKVSYLRNDGKGNEHSSCYA